MAVFIIVQMMVRPGIISAKKYNKLVKTQTPNISKLNFSLLNPKSKPFIQHLHYNKNICN